MMRHAGAGDSGAGALTKRRERKMRESRPLALGRRGRPCGQLNDFVCCFNAVIHGYPDYRVAFLDHHSSLFGSFSGRVCPLRLPIHLEQKSADLGSLALREHSCTMSGAGSSASRSLITLVAIRCLSLLRNKSVEKRSTVEEHS